MQLFYHATRDIELPRPGRRGLLSEPARACEACGRGIEPDPAGTGRGALAFCTDCRDRMDRSAIQIHFCDACSVSLPIEAVAQGAALAADGRILCPACLARLPRPRAAGGPPLLLVAGLAVLAIALGVFLAARAA